MAWLKTRKGIIVILAVLLLIIFIIWNTFFGFYQGTGKSMGPAMAEGEVYIVKKTLTTYKEEISSSSKPLV